MCNSPCKRASAGRSRDGYVLVVCVLLLALITMLAVGMLSLANIELRRSAQGEAMERARGNARLAMMLAIGQLQRTLGPDQRVSATAEILGGNPAQPHWTGAWRSTLDDGTPFLVRDPVTGSLHDARADDAAGADRVMEWLVSGDDPDPGAPPSNLVRLFGDADDPDVEAAMVPIRNSTDRIEGNLAWWTGDLGVRANISTQDPRADLAFGKDGGTDESWYRLMLSQAPDIERMNGGIGIEPEILDRFASQLSVSLGAGTDWAETHAFDFTVGSRGVLADVSRGGLKRDLTAWLDSAGSIAGWKGLEGITDTTPLIGRAGGEEQDVNRLSPVSPTFGRLRDWALAPAPMSGGGVDTRVSELDTRAGSSSADFALANESPVKLDGNTRSALQPVLVEATNFIQLSCYQLAGSNPGRYQLRHHLYPRVVLWNPYNVSLDLDRSMVMIQGNGRQEMWTENQYFDAKGKPIYRWTTAWVSFEGGRSTAFGSGGSLSELMGTEGYNDPYIGSYFFAIPQTRFEPGECLVFSPARQAEYDCLSAYRTGSYDLNQNELSCDVPPDPSRSFCITGTDIDGGQKFRPEFFWYAPTPLGSVGLWGGIKNQSDDTRAVLKRVGNRSTVSFEDFDAMPQISVVSASLQYGAGREPRISWNEKRKMPVELLDQFNPQPTVTPDVRTRESVRLRWFQEHLSNQINSGPLSGTPHFDEALLANWNPRAAFSARTPWDNVAGSMPLSGSAGGPWFFGAYTRDLFDQDVSWQEQTPVVSGGRSRGNPFGPPQEGRDRIILFEVPRDSTGVVSIGQFQHAPLSDLVWHPSFAVGNSLADPRLGTGALTRTVPPTE
ncbi:MAG: hypothetical protein KDN05_15130, partial [Verrucomicrobiae bacterium]|nr:hypothetical protein [Verrucomicrobiae bacterium]